MFVGLRGLLCLQIFILNIISVSDPKNIIQHDYQNANLHGNIAKLYANAWKPRLTWKSILVFEPTGGGRFSNLNISKMVRDINKLFSKYENLVF